VEAALGIARVLEKKPPAIVLVGGCGAYPGSTLQIGEIVLGEEMVLAPEGELPEIVATRSRPELFEVSARRVIVASTLGITTDDGRASILRRETNADVENLEAFAVARACELARIPVAILLGVTNGVGKNGRAEWRANAKRVAALVNAALRNRSTPRSPA